MLAFVVALGAFGPAGASAPPLRRYTTADGLPTDTVTALLADTRGFLWVGTDDGLARFDGDRFELFDDRNGLPAGLINAILEHPDGTLFVAAEGGLSRLAAGPGPPGGLFEPLAAPSKEAGAVDDLALGPDASVMAATHAGLFRLVPSATEVRWESIPIHSSDPQAGPACTFVDMDDRGDLWAGCGDQLVRILADGRVDRWDLRRRLATSLGAMWFLGMLQDRLGRRWIGGSGFLWRLVDDPRPDRDPIAADHSDCPGGSPRIFDLLRRRDGSVWAGTSGGPAAVLEEAPAGSCALGFLHEGEGSTFHLSRALAEDDAGNLWSSESSHGLVRIPAQGFTYYDRERGVPYRDVSSIAQGPRGEVVVQVAGVLFVLDGERFRRLDPRLPEGVVAGWGAGQRMLFDRRGGFWLATRTGLFRWSGLESAGAIGRRPADRVYTMAEGLPSQAVMRLFEDRDGDVWIGPEEGSGRQICRWSRPRDVIECFGAQDGVPPVRLRAIEQDATGQLWFGFRDGTLLRRRRERFERLNGTPGFLPGEINALLADRAGSLWVAAPRRGLYRIDRCDDEIPSIRLYARESGLSSLDLRCLVSDPRGRIYLGTGRGIDRLDPATGHVRHYTRQEGLLDTSLATAMRADDGSLWFGTADGIARLAPRPDPVPRPPRVYIMGLRIAGEARPVPARGAVRLGDLRLASGQNNVQIDFTGINHAPGERLAFQTWLEGAEPGWSDPSARRSIVYARLAPGAYRFLVRAVSADGVASDSAASLAFEVAAPVWRRWWFVTLAAAGALAVGVSFHRQRAARLVELERVRTRIATDLHDEVGAGLSEIALMGEVWGRRQPGGDEVPHRIAAASRRLVDAMSDIVWAINPERDRVFSLSQRMRRFATGLTRSAGITLRFESIDESQDRALDGDTRRELLLAFQEIVNNAVRHAGCGRLDVRLEIRGASLMMKVIDDGAGFDLEAIPDGTGLSSIRGRVGRLGGLCRFESSPSAGTRVTLEVPLRARSRHGGRSILPVRGGEPRSG